MRTGIFEREFTETKDVWVPRGFSQRTKTYVYPNTGWSWTDWGAHVQDTFETREAAVKGISRGYLKDMIATQEIVDIVFINMVTERKIAERRVVTAYDKAGNPVDSTPAAPVQGVNLINDSDYLLFSRVGDLRTPALYGYVRAIRSDEAYIGIINGAWTMTVRQANGKLYMIPHEDDDNQSPIELIIHQIGAPDRDHRPDDYHHQMAFWKDQQKETA